jgi:hypothetical protein
MVVPCPNNLCRHLFFRAEPWAPPPTLSCCLPDSCAGPAGTSEARISTKLLVYIKTLFMRPDWILVDPPADCVKKACSGPLPLVAAGQVEVFIRVRHPKETGCIVKPYHLIQAGAIMDVSAIVSSPILGSQRRWPGRRKCHFPLVHRRAGPSGMLRLLWLLAAWSLPVATATCASCDVPDASALSFCSSFISYAACRSGGSWKDMVIIYYSPINSGV